MTDQQKASRQRIDALADVFRGECAALTRGASRFVDEHVDDPTGELAKVFKIAADHVGDLGRADDAEIGRRVRELVVEPAWRRAAMERA